MALELIDVMRKLYNISGFSITIHDIDFNQLYSYPPDPLPFCRLLRSDCGIHSRCKECDYAAFEKVKASGETYIYRCHAGLTEAVVPIYTFGILSGYMMMGQTLDGSPLNEERARAVAREMVRSDDELDAQMAQIPVRTEEQMQSCISIMEICGAYISLANLLRSGERDLATLAREFLDENYADKITLELLCETLYCSRATLTGAFRAAHGCSVGEYLAGVRVKHAKELLAETNLSLDDVAARCGFSDRGYFAKVFKRRCGITPGDYREQERKK